MEARGRVLQTANFIVSVSLLFVFSSCQGSTNPVHSSISEDKNQSIVNELDTLKKQFNQFREFVRESRKNDTKAFFEFPISSQDLWYKVLDDKEVEKHLGNPFTEKDFETYFDKLFIKSFKECLSDIDVQQLFGYGKFSTKPLTSKENNYWVKSQIEATFSKGELKLVFNSIVQDKENDTEAEHTEVYIFNIIGNELKFATFYMAG